MEELWEDDYQALQQLMLEQEAMELDEAYNEWLGYQKHDEQSLEIMEEYYGQN